jgi:transcriptional regulator with XRE-family HTH domain
MELGSTIRLLREKHGLKQINLANALQVSPQAVSKWEKDANYPDMETLKKIARLFDVSTDFLLGNTERESGIFEATVLCTGITGFAERSVSTDARDLAEYMNGVFFHLTQSALKFDGIPVKYVGDGFLCFFSGADHADRALSAALHARKVVYQKDLVQAIHTGEIYLGLVGHPNYAARDIIGSTVNRAFLILNWVSKHCPSCLAATGAALEKTRKSYTTVRHQNVTIDLIGETTDLFEIV